MGDPYYSTLPEVEWLSLTKADAVGVILIARITNPPMRLRQENAALAAFERQHIIGEIIQLFIG
jgi:hypothetical protein